MDNIAAIQKFVASVSPETQKSDLLLKFNGRDIVPIEKASMGIVDKILYFFRFLGIQRYSISSIVRKLETMEQEYEKMPELGKTIHLATEILKDKQLPKECRRSLNENQKSDIEKLKYYLRELENADFDKAMKVEENGSTLLQLLDKIAEAKSAKDLETNYALFLKMHQKISTQASENPNIKNYIGIITDAFKQREQAIHTKTAVEQMQGAITNGGNSCYLNSITQALRFVTIDPKYDTTTLAYRQKAKEVMTSEVLKNIDRQSIEAIEKKLQEQGLDDTHRIRVEIARILLSFFDESNKKIADIAKTQLEKVNPRNPEEVKKTIENTLQRLEEAGFKNADRNFSECVFVLQSSLRNLRWKEKTNEKEPSVKDELAEILKKSDFQVESSEKALKSAGNITATQQAREVLPQGNIEKVIQDANNPDPELAKALTEQFASLQEKLNKGDTVTAQEINNFRNLFIDCNFKAAQKNSQEDAQEACVKLLEALQISSELILIDMKEAKNIQQVVQQKYNNNKKNECPATLPISLTRYSFDLETGRSKKIKKAFPLEKTVQIQDKEGNTLTYQLASTVIHAGDDPKYGHYYTYAEKDGAWHELNDQQIYSRKLDSIQNNIEENGYLFFYKKVG